MYLYNNFSYDCNDACNGNHDMAISSFTWLDIIVNSQLSCRSISGFGDIGVDVETYLFQTCFRFAYVEL